MLVSILSGAALMVRSRSGADHTKGACKKCAFARAGPRMRVPGLAAAHAGGATPGA